MIDEYNKKVRENNEKIERERSKKQKDEAFSKSKRTSSQLSGGLLSSMQQQEDSILSNSTTANGATGNAKPQLKLTISTEYHSIITFRENVFISAFSSDLEKKSTRNMPQTSMNFSMNKYSYMPTDSTTFGSIEIAAGKDSDNYESNSSAGCFCCLFPKKKRGGKRK